MLPGCSCTCVRASVRARARVFSQLGRPVCHTAQPTLLSQPGVDIGGAVTCLFSDGDQLVSASLCEAAAGVQGR